MNAQETIEEEFKALYEAATNSRQQESLTRIKHACDYLENMGIRLTPTSVERYCIDRQWGGPKAQSIRNSRDVLYRYLMLRQSKQRVTRGDVAKEQRPAIQDETLKAYVHLLEQERDLALAARSRIEAALRTIPGVHIDEVIAIGFTATPTHPMQTIKSGRPPIPDELKSALLIILDEAHLTSCGLQIYRDRIRTITTKQVLFEKAHVEAIRKWIAEAEAESDASADAVKTSTTS
jgi:hypothetical protein